MCIKRSLLLCHYVSRLFTGADQGGRGAELIGSGVAKDKLDLFFFLFVL